MSMKMSMKMRSVHLFFIFITAGLIALILGCSTNSDGYFYPALGLNEGRILVVNSVVTPASYTISMYDLDGNFISVVADTTPEGYILRGIAQFDLFSFILSGDTPDSLRKLNIATGELTSYSTNANLNGNVYGIAKRASNSFLVAKTSNIELLSGNTRYGAPYIAATLGACTISNARGLTMNSANDLIVTSITNSQVLRYDVSSPVASCLAANNTIGANQPVPVMTHTNGNIYVGTQVDDAIYELPEDFTAGSAATAIISGTTYTNNPTAIAELPNGNLLVGSDGNDNIIEIATDGTVINSSFIKNAFTGTVVGIKVITGE